MSTKTGNENKVGIMRVVINMALIATLAVLFNFYPEWVGSWRSADDPSSFSSLLGPGYRIYLPALNLWWCLVLGLNIIHLYTRRRTPVTRWFGAALNVYLVIMLTWMALGAPNFFKPAAMFWLRPILGLLALSVFLKAFWQVRFIFPKPLASG